MQFEATHAFSIVADILGAKLKLPTVEISAGVIYSGISGAPPPINDGGAVGNPSP